MNINFSSVKILVIDDDKDDFLIISDYIQLIPENQSRIDWCYNYDEALDHIRRRTHQIYFVDYRLGAKTGLDLLKQAMEMDCQEPIILLTGKGNHAIDIKAMQTGATDYLIKSELNTEKLERCIRYALERSASVQALRENEKKYRNIFEKSKDAVFLADPEFRFKDVNPATCELMGYKRGELIGMNFYELLSPEATKVLQDQLSDSGEVRDLELEVQTKSKEKKACILSVGIQTDKDNSFILQGILHDITNIKKTEKANLQIEKLAATGRLIRTLAHEVRNPLNNINMSVDQLLTEPRSEDDQIYFDIIQRNSKRIDNLITELLESSRPYDLNFQPHSLQDIMDETLSMAIDRIKLRNIKLEKEYPDQEAVIRADKDKLKLALLNFVINAVEAVEEKTGELKISINSRDNRHILNIRDNGCGIAEENLSRLFEPYFTTKRNGIGLGLASSLNILQSHKAKIDVRSALNAGTQFTISFVE
ncbi:MAG TPA: ATP-binding protein [Chitinophagaceae bacterium]